MTQDDRAQPEDPTHRPRFCTTCGAEPHLEDRFCPRCGADLAKQATQHLSARDDVGNSTGADEGPVPVPVGQQVETPRKRRRKRRWYRRPLFVIPLALVAVVVAIGGVVAYRTYNAFSEVNAVSTPPPEISGEALGGGDDLEIDTGPAQEAVRQWEIAQAEDAEKAEPAATSTTPPEATDPASTSTSQVDATEPGVVATETPLEDDDDVIGPSGAGTSRATEPATEEPESAATATESVATERASDTMVADGDDSGINILLMGVDAREGEAIDVGVRPDSLGILNLNEEDGTCRILAIPRDSRVEIPGYGMSKVNHALAVGGIPFEMLVLEQYLDISIDHYALVDFAGLVAVVDAFGGVTVDNPEAFELSGQTFAAGEIHLDGEQALLYSRYRGGVDGDFGRVAKQQQVLKALLDEATESNLSRLVPDMWNLLQDHFRTDYGMFDMLNTANDFRGVCTSANLETETIPGAVQTLPDDMMNMNLSFVVSDPAEVEASIQWLLSGDPAPGGESVPEATPAATPSTDATPAATPGSALIWRHDQGW